MPFLLDMVVYSFIVAWSAKRTYNKVLLVCFAVLLPAMSGFRVYFFKGYRESEVALDTPNSYESLQPDRQLMTFLLRFGFCDRGSLFWLGSDSSKLSGRCP